MRAAARAAFTYTKDAMAHPKTVKMTKENFIANLYFCVIWMLLPLVTWPNLPEPVELGKVLIFMIATFTYLGHNLRKIPSPITIVKKNVFLQILLVLLLIQLVSSLLGPRPVTSLLGQLYRYQGWLTQVSYITFVLALIPTYASPTRWISWGGLALSVVALLEYVTLHPGRVTGPLGNPNFTGGYLALSLAFQTHPLAHLLTLIALVTTGSRSAILAASLVIFLKIYARLKNTATRLTVALLFIVPLVVTLPRRAPSSFDTRPEIWQRGIVGALTRPILGWGLENYELAFRSTLIASDFDLKNIRVDKAHNELLEILVATGTIGLGLYLVLLARMAKKATTRGVGDPYFLSFCAFLILSSLNILSLSEYLFFYLILARLAQSPKRLPT